METQLEDKLPDEKVDVKLSICNDCQGIVRVAIVHMMTIKTKNSFMKEVMEHNLSVKQQPLLQYREENAKSCLCK